ncbi:hypothetical protein GUJ93_ZPchr0002g24437 [Zizania palustris]|uniref:Uncharacterized protein n=1 Tax=Zizania palustris TaxID=103762 RepID=A0A8J5RD95_ZIZPA|nr:hypothetical protein GUJ93_ZPchr0002g24437 [Zizania palustris]
MGFPTAPSPPSSDAEVEAQGERKDREALSPILIEVVDQQGEVALVEPSADDATLMADKRAMEQVALAAPSLVVKAEAQGGGGEGEVVIGQTLAKLPLPQAASALEKAHRATPTVETPWRVKSLHVVIPAEDGGSERRVLGSRSKGPRVAPTASKGDGGVFEGWRQRGPSGALAASKGPRVAPAASKGPHVAPAASKGEGGDFEGRRRRGPGWGVGGFEGAARGAGGFEEGRRRLQRESPRTSPAASERGVDIF